MNKYFAHLVSEDINHIVICATILHSQVELAMNTIH